MSPHHDLTGVRRPGICAVVLTAVAGYVDAFVFLRVSEVFIANQSGNLIVGGMTAAGSDLGDISLPIASVIAYVVGAAAAAALFDRPSRQGRRRLIDTVAAVIVALAGAAAALAIAGEGHHAGGSSPLVLGVVAATALSMGAQATAVRRTGGVAVLTTASTGAITTLGVELGRHRGRLDPAARTRVSRLVAVVTAYVGGAAAGAALSLHTGLGPELLLVPCVALAGILVGQRGGAPSSVTSSE
jgi:uncharacterized membrane protein YoaK (UPF0700 family)